jgi:anti-sigma factor RsiW
MMTCRQCAELLSDFLDGTMPAAEREVFEKHLSRCPPCVTYMETYRLTIKLTTRLVCGPLPQHVERRLRELVAREIGQQSSG